LSSRRRNDAAGTALSWLTGIAYHAWRSEHNWHHGNQGRLSRRGVDRMNSPMTVEEAHGDPAGAALREKKISWPNVFFLGTLSLVVERKRHHAFFMFRPKFQGPVPDRDALVRSVWTTNLGHVVYHAAMIAALGWANWAFVLVPGMLAGAGVGALMFWVQHNFEHTYHAPDGAWNYVEVALHGSSYLNLPWPLSWFTGAIGLHHVHHLNPLIPNYRLEAARRAIPELAAVTPLGWSDLSRCFTHIFWDGTQGRMVPPEPAIEA
jgi:omega-6 fatty acid desaturase (delta-12 desaturase)